MQFAFHMFLEHKRMWQPATYIVSEASISHSLLN